MKTLYLCRHAKASWEAPVPGDRERPLLSAGIARTRQVIQYLNNHRVTPGLILSSPATRALETARLVAEGIGYPSDEIRIENAIYEQSYSRILEIICSLPDETESVMVFGHNPHLTLLTTLFASKGIDNLPTSGISCFEFDTGKWEEITRCPRETKFILHPRKLM